MALIITGTATGLTRLYAAETSRPGDLAGSAAGLAGNLPAAAAATARFMVCHMPPRFRLSIPQT
ncbi:hypothetical protein DGWBC_1371 [Dehalogenimonas sp. WBC-2]|nr:hypothetical protein DGWBC_1371 [Dehalogenimonas sp. WBC-2]